MSDIDGLLCQEKIAKEELDQALHYQYLFWKERAKMFWFKDRDKNTAFFHVVVKRRNNSSGIHLRIDNVVIEDPKLIEEHILNFYKTLYAECISHVQDTNNMEDFIGTYIPELVSFEENMMLIKCPDFLKSRVLFLTLMVIVLLVLMVLVVFFITLVGKLLGQMFAMQSNSFVNKTWFSLK